MEPFYTELKKLRESQNIDLAEIQNRTKINIQFLDALENGQFDVLPMPYIRLFLRAYVTEIGGDPTEALTQLEHYLSAQEGKPKPANNKAIVEKTGQIKTETTSISRSPFKIRSNLIKAAILLMIWIFAIIIIRKITLESGEAAASGLSGTYAIQGPEPVTEDKLRTDYIEISSNTKILDVTPPLSVKIFCTQPVTYQVQQDTVAKRYVTSLAGEQQSYAYTDQLDFIFNHTEGVTFFINAETVSAIASYSSPVHISFRNNPVMVTFKRFALIPIN